MVDFPDWESETVPFAKWLIFLVWESKTIAIAQELIFRIGNLKLFRLGNG
jgi:hypothetical protein